MCGTTSVTGPTLVGPGSLSFRRFLGFSFTCSNMFLYVFARLRFCVSVELDLQTETLLSPGFLGLGYTYMWLYLGK